MGIKLKKGLSITLGVLVLLSNFLSFGISSVIAENGTANNTIPDTKAASAGNTPNIEHPIQNQNKISNNKIAVISDPHYYAPELGTTGTAFNNYLSSDRKMLAESKAILESTIDLIKNSDAEIVLVCGDLTKDGELLSHQQFAKHLKQLKDAGKKVYVIDGNHDINNPDASSYNADQVTSVANITPADFKKIYHNYGYGDAVAVDPNSLSYAVDPAPGLRIIAMDSALYDTNIADHAPKTAGAFSTSRQAWIDAEIADGVAKGKRVIGMMHHGVTNHFSLESQLFPEYVIQDADQVASDLRSKGMKVVFTGHFHAQDITEKQLPNNQVIFDVETGSLMTYPVPYRSVDLASDGKLTINTNRVNNINYDTGNESFQNYAKGFLVKGLEDLVPQMLAGIIMQQNPSMTADQALALANNAASQVVAPPYTVKDLLVNAMVAHYEGDEYTDSQMLAIYQGMAASSDAMTKTLGGALLSLGTDLAPADNNVILNLNNGNIVPPVVAPSLILKVAPGKTGGTTKVTAKTCGGNHLIVKVASASIDTPKVGDAVPTGTGVINPYSSGKDISGVNLSTKNYIAVYEADRNNKVVKFKLVTLTSSTINPYAPELKATAKLGTNADGIIITATVGADNHLVLKVSSKDITIPKTGDGAPTGTGVIDPYVSGTKINGVDLKKNKYMGVYEVDTDNKVVGFKVITKSEVISRIFLYSRRG